MRISDVKALVTGGGTGIGLETARQLGQQGAQVAIAGRRAEVLEQAAEEVGALPIVLDVRDESQARAAVEKVVGTFGDYNVLINNAAYGNFGMLQDLELESFRDLMETNVFGATIMARESARHFIQKETGNIVNVSSTAGGKGFAGGTAYVASKFALGGMTECWRAELRKHNIRVMQVNPSEVLTDFAQTAGYDQKQSERKLRGTEIAHAIVSMLSMDDRGFITDLTVFATNPD